MTLFGRTFDGSEMTSLVFMLAVLFLWIIVWRRERGWGRWFARWEADRKARRDAELSMERNGERPPRSSDGPRGPWG